MSYRIKNVILISIIFGILCFFRKLVWLMVIFYSILIYFLEIYSIFFFGKVIIVEI